MTYPTDPPGLDRDYYSRDLEAEEEIERIFEENRETDHLAQTLIGLPETKFGIVPDSILPIFEFDEAQRAFQRMMYYSRFQEVG